MNHTWWAWCATVRAHALRCQNKEQQQDTVFMAHRCPLHPRVPVRRKHYRNRVICHLWVLVCVTPASPHNERLYSPIHKLSKHFNLSLFERGAGRKETVQLEFRVIAAVEIRTCSQHHVTSLYWWVTSKIRYRVRVPNLWAKSVTRDEFWHQSRSGNLQSFSFYGLLWSVHWWFFLLMHQDKI